jgi:putative transposase
MRRAGTSRRSSRSPTRPKTSTDSLTSGTEVGIDLGLASFAVLSDGTVVESPRFLRRAEKKLREAQLDLSREQKGSDNLKKAVVKVARVHAHVAAARRDHHHKLSTRISPKTKASTWKTSR